MILAALRAAREAEHPEAEPPPVDDSQSTPPTRELAPQAAGEARESAAHYALAKLTGEAFAAGMTADEAVADLGLAAMRLGFEPAEAEKLIRAFYGTLQARENPAEAIGRLARMGVVEYEAARASEAKRLKMRASVLDREVEKVRAKNGTAASGAAPKAEPPKWAEPAAIADGPVDSAQLLADLIGAIRQFVAIDQSAALITALWSLFTWSFEYIGDTNPFLRVFSPESSCGKSTLLKALKYITRAGWHVSRLSPSAFVRTLGRERRTLLLDETDAALHDNEPMRNLLDSASDPDTSTVSFSVKSGDDWNPIELNCYVPICLVSIGFLRGMQTVERRSIHLRMKRATRPELKALTKSRRRNLKAILEPLAARAARWALDNGAALAALNPEVPAVLDGRESDNWEPILRVADLCGAGVEARAAAIAAAGAGSEAGTESLNLMLLADIKTVFDAEGVDRLPSQSICERLTAIEERPLAELGRTRRPITPNRLARLLSGFAIVPHSIRLPDGPTPKGYQIEDFRDAWSRYLPDVKVSDPPIGGNSNRHNATTVGAVGQNDDFTTATEDACGGSKNDISTYGENKCGVVADQNGDTDADHEIPAADAAGEEEVF
jgi:hypothetical protein